MCCKLRVDRYDIGHEAQTPKHRSLNPETHTHTHAPTHTRFSVSLVSVEHKLLCDSGTTISRQRSVCLLCYKLRVVRLGIADRAPELEFQGLKRLPLRKLRQNVFYSGTVWRAERRCRHYTLSREVQISVM